MGRDVQQPVLMFAWTAPGLKRTQKFCFRDCQLGVGRRSGSRLYQKLINEQELATDLQVDIYDLFDQSVFFVHIDPIDEQAIASIEKIVSEEIEKIKKDGPEFQ